MSDLTHYQIGALTRQNLEDAPSGLAAFKDPALFAKSLGWYQTKTKRNYTEKQAEDFLLGYAAAHEVLK